MSTPLPSKVEKKSLRFSRGRDHRGHKRKYRCRRRGGVRQHLDKTGGGSNSRASATDTTRREVCMGRVGESFTGSHRSSSLRRSNGGARKGCRRRTNVNKRAEVAFIERSRGEWGMALVGFNGGRTALGFRK